MNQEQIFNTDKYLLTNYSVNCYDAAKYLIGLYYKVGEKYTCTLTTIKQLLVIYQLWCLKNNKDGLINEKLTFTKNFFDLDAKLSSFFYINIINGNKDINNKVITDEFLHDYDIPPLYQVEENYIPNEVKDLLIKIFRIFGNWSIESFYLESKYILDQIYSLENVPKSLTKDLLNNELNHIWENEKNSLIIKFIKENKPQYTIDKTTLNQKKILVDFEYWFLNNLSSEEQIECLENLNAFDLNRKNNKTKVKSFQKKNN